MEDPYLENGVLRNLVGATSSAELAYAESSLTTVRLFSVIQDWPLTSSGDLDEWRLLHKTLFQDLFDWAGELRTIDIRKMVPDANPFAQWDWIPHLADNQSSQLKDDDMLKGLSKSEFVKKLAFHYEAFNYIHPFRDGNGRVARLFWDRISAGAGWAVSWSLIDGETNGRLAREASRGDLSGLIEMFTRITEPAALWPPEERSVWLVGVMKGAHELVEPTYDVGVLPTAVGPLTGGGRTETWTTGTCSHFMPRAKKLCILTDGHRGHHRSVLRRSSATA